MIRILASNASAILKYGIKPIQKAKVKGSLGKKPGELSFGFKSVHLKTLWRDTHIETILEIYSELFLRSIDLIFRFKSPRPTRDLVVWTESYSDEFKSGKTNSLPGTLSRNTRREGAWAMWISESVAADGLFLKQDHPANYPIIFECRPRNHSLSIRWNINHRLKAQEKLNFSSVMLSRGPVGKLVPGWRQEWSTAKVFPKGGRLGWCDSGESKTQKDLLEILSALRRNKIKVDWFAFDSQYASQMGDWLTPKNPNRMNMLVRTVMEQNIVPGLRFAPFLASKKSSLASEKRNWLVNDGKGMPITVKRYGFDGDKCYILDLSNPQVLDHVHHMFLLLREQWGFRTFYLERLGDSLMPGLRHRRSHGADELLNDAAMAIRTAVGDKGFLIAADLPLLSTRGIWDARVMTRSIEKIRSRSFVDNQHSKITIASTLLHRSAWNETAWINTAGMLPISLFNTRHDSATNTLITAVALSCGLVCFSGDPREIDMATQSSVQEFLTKFADCRKGRISLMPRADGDINNPLAVRNSQGWMALFNFSDKRARMRLDTRSLQSLLRASIPLSTENGAIFNSPEIHVALPPRGHRLFRG